MTSSPFIKLALPTRKQLTKPVTITLPLPPNQLRTKRPQTAVAKTSREVEARPATARPTSTQDRKGIPDLCIDLPNHACVKIKLFSKEKHQYHPCTVDNHAIMK